MQPMESREWIDFADLQRELHVPPSWTRRFITRCGVRHRVRPDGTILVSSADLLYIRWNAQRRAAYRRLKLERSRR